MTLLAGKISIEEGDPFVTLIEPGVFDIAKVGPALIEFRLDQLQRLLGKFEVQASDFPGRIEFADVMLFLLQVEADLLALIAQSEFGGV